MNFLNSIITKAKFFFSTYKWLLIPLIPIILFVYFIIVIITANQTKTPTSNQQGKASQAPTTGGSPQTQASLSPSGQPETYTQDNGLSDEVQSIASGKQSIDEGSSGGEGSDNEYADMSISNKILSDGSVEYEYQSDDPERPHMQVVKNGVVLFRRNLMPDDTTTDYYAAYLQNPEYTSQGSSYYGASVMIFASPTNGIAIVLDPQSRQVYEQYLFPALSVSDYQKKFGADITAFNPAP